MKDFLLTGKVAFVTGAAMGLGAGIAKTLAAAQAHVFLADINLEGARAKASELTALGYKAEAIFTDVTSEKSVDDAFEVLKNNGGIDVLVNNAGSYIGVGGSILDQEVEYWRNCMRINMESAFLCSRRACQLMVAQGRGGSIVNVTSVDALIPTLGVGYDTAKAAVNHLARSIAIDVMGYGIRANNVAPGLVAEGTSVQLLFEGKIPPLVDPEGSSSGLAGPVTAARAQVLRPGKLDDIGNAVLFFASDASKFVTGQTLCVDGGWTTL